MAVIIPSINELNNIDPQAVVKFILQGDRPDDYEPRIYLKREVYTRPDNLHDFYNAKMWLTYPKLKLHFNEIQYKNILYRREYNLKQRTRAENIYTHLDECGIIVVYKNVELIELIRQKRWIELFWDKRDLIANTMDFKIIGHAIWEKLVNPYIGLTAKAIFVKADADYFNLTETEKNKYVDEQAVKLLNQQIQMDNLAKPVPLPILGIPGWHKFTDYKSFYEIKSYFRS